MHVCKDTCHKPTIKQRRGYPMCWVFGFCDHQSAGVLDPAVKRLAQIWAMALPIVGAKA